MMLTNRKLYLAIAGITITVIVGFAIGNFVSSYKLGRLEAETHRAKSLASEKQAASNDLERQAAVYKAKTEYLEGQLAGIQAIARKQDEELEKLGNSVSGARRDVERSRSIRSIGATADELCAKLAELGHGCE